MTYEQETLWLAGLLEGEGCFYRQAHCNGMHIKLQMTDEDVVRKAAIIMNVSCYPQKPATLNRKPTWRLNCSGDKAVAIAKRILPFMGRRRKEKIEELLSFAALRMSLAERAARARASRRITKRDNLTVELPLWK